MCVLLRALTADNLIGKLPDQHFPHFYTNIDSVLRKRVGNGGSIDAGLIGAFRRASGLRVEWVAPDGGGGPLVATLARGSLDNLGDLVRLRDQR
jgi:hypothetical protein